MPTPRVPGDGSARLWRQKTLCCRPSGPDRTGVCGARSRIPRYLRSAGRRFEAEPCYKAIRTPVFFEPRVLFSARTGGWFGRCVTTASSVYPVSEVLGVIIPEPSRRPHDIATLTKGTLKGI